VAFNTAAGGINGRIIGVVADTHFESIHASKVPIVYFVPPPNPSGFRDADDFIFTNLVIRAAGGEVSNAIENIHSTWQSFYPNNPIEMELVNDLYRRLYNDELRQKNLFNIFSIISLAIASAGILGLGMFLVESRDREFAVRKILGANVRHIIALINKDTLILIFLANLAAWPISYYLMQNWLDNFAYHVDLRILSFFQCSMVVLFLSVVILSLCGLHSANTISLRKMAPQ
jgi:putative ABC transport system permease protein